MKDYIVRATAGDGQIRAFAATTGNLVEEARKRHDTSPVATAALGRLLTAGAMMGGMMKNETDVLTLQIKGDGPLGGITVTADAKGDVKGYVDHPEAMMPPKNGKLDVGGAVGIGLLNVIKDMGLKEPYVGQTILQTSEIAEDLTYYFATSEQVPSSVGLGVLMNKDNTVHCAGGFIVQVMPFISDEVLDKLEENIKKISSVEMQRARDSVGASGRKSKVTFTDREWEAVQAGAISDNMLTKFLNSSDSDEIVKRAMPKNVAVMTSAKMSKANAMLKSGYSYAEIAKACGVPESTVYSALNK